MIADIDMDEAEGTASGIRGTGVRSIAVKNDVTSIDDAARTADLVMERFGRIDVLVNNAGICRHEKAERMKTERNRALYEENGGAVRRVRRRRGYTVW